MKSRLVVVLLASLGGCATAHNPAPQHAKTKSSEQQEREAEYYRQSQGALQGPPSPPPISSGPALGSRR